MITDKRLAEIRTGAVFEYTEFLELVECYEAARTYANEWQKPLGKTNILGAGLKLIALFPEEK